MNKELLKLRSIIADDGLCISYQSMSQYRTMLLNEIERLLKISDGFGSELSIFEVGRCSCENVEMGSYDNVIKVQYNGQWIDIDGCIYEEIRLLWDKGITTLASCCGHQKEDGVISVIGKDVKKMKIIGYEPHPDINNTFYARSVKRLK